MQNSEKTKTVKYQQIIDAATRVFAQKGYYNSKVSDIAKEAEVADGTIYLYFKNKEDILISIFESSMDVFISTVREHLQKIQDPVLKLIEFIRLHLELVQENQDTAQVLQIELRQSSKFMKEYDVAKFKSYLDMIAEIIQEGQDQGVFDPNINLSVMKRSIFGAVDEMALEWVLLKKKRYSIDDCANTLAAVFIRGMSIDSSVQVEKASALV